MYRLILVALMLLVPCTQAQDFTLFSYDLFPASPLSDSPATATITRLNVGGAYPITLAHGRVRLVNMIQYQQMNVDYSDWPEAVPAPTRLHYVRHTVAAIQSFATGWQATLALTSGLATDFQATATADDLHLRAVALIERKRAGTTVYGAGITYRNRLDLQVLPIVRVRMPLSRHLRLDATAPAYVRLWYHPRPTNPLAFGLETRFSTTPYHLSQDQSYLLHKTITGHLNALIPLRGAFALSLSPGFTLRNRLKYGRGKDALAHDLQPHPYFRAALVVRQ